MGIIYKLTSPDGKGYIGQTKKTFEQRMYSHKSSTSNLNKKDGCRYLNNAVRAAGGWDTFHKEIIFECDNDKLNDYEKYFIAEFDTLCPNGYNLTSGGDSNKTFSDETLKKMSKSALERDSNAYRKKEITKGWPKYLGMWGGSPRITKHPNCSSKTFNDPSKTFDENLQDAKEFLNQLNEGKVKVEHTKNRQGIQLTKGGYRVHYRNKNNAVITKLFTVQSMPLTERERLANEYLDKLIENDK